MVGGFNRLLNNELNTYSRIYTALPNHDIIYFSMRLHVMDSWDSLDTGMIFFDDRFMIVLKGFGGTYATSICGNPNYNDLLGITVSGKVFHNASSLNFSLASITDDTSYDESLGISKVKLNFDFKSVTEVQILSVLPPSSNPTIVFSTNQFICSSPKYYNWDMTCADSCPSKFHPRTSNGNLYCDYPCSDTDFLYPDGSCQSSCLSPSIATVQSGKNFCDYRQNAQSIPTTNTTTPSSSATTTTTTTVSATTTMSQAVSVGLKAAAVLNSANPSFCQVAGLSEIIQYVRYMRVDYPPNLLELFQAQNGWASSFEFFPDMPSAWTESFDKQSLVYEFEQYSLDSEFVINYWSVLLSLISSVGIVLIFWMLERIASTVQAEGDVHRILRKAYRLFRWDLPLTILIGSSSNLAFFASVQLRYVQLTPTAEVLSLIVCTIMSIIMAALIYRNFSIAYSVLDAAKQKKKIGNQYNDYRIIYIEFKKESIWQLAYISVFIIRLSLPCVVIGLLTTFPFLQICILNFTSLLMLTYLILVRPFHSKLLLIQTIYNEFVILTVNICVGVLVGMDSIGYTDIQTRLNIGNVVIYINTIFTYSCALFLVFQLVIGIVDLVRRFRRDMKRGVDSFFRILLLMFTREKLEEKTIKRTMRFEHHNPHQVDTQILAIQKPYNYTLSALQEQHRDTRDGHRANNTKVNAEGELNTSVTPILDTSSELMNVNLAHPQRLGQNENPRSHSRLKRRPR